MVSQPFDQSNVVVFTMFCCDAAVAIEHCTNNQPTLISLRTRSCPTRAVEPCGIGRHHHRIQLPRGGLRLEQRSGSHLWKRLSMVRSLISYPLNRR